MNWGLGYWEGMSRAHLDVPSDFRGCDPGRVSSLVVRGVHLHVGGVTVSFF